MKSKNANGIGGEVRNRKVHIDFETKQHRSSAWVRNSINRYKVDQQEIVLNKRFILSWRIQTNAIKSILTGTCCFNSSRLYQTWRSLRRSWPESWFPVQTIHSPTSFQDDTAPTPYLIKVDLDAKQQLKWVQCRTWLWLQLPLCSIQTAHPWSDFQARYGLFLQNCFRPRAQQLWTILALWTRYSTLSPGPANIESSALT